MIFADVFERIETLAVNTVCKCMEKVGIDLVGQKTRMVVLDDSRERVLAENNKGRQLQHSPSLGRDIYG